MTPTSDQITLGNAPLIAKGGHRSCYAHPEDAQLCVKVLHEPWQKIDRRLNDPLRAIRRQRNFDENLSEWIELKRLEKKLGALHTKHFPRAHALVKTDKGEALVADFIRDHNGSPSPTLKSYLWQHGLSEACAHAINEFWDFLKTNKVMVRDPFPHNLLVKRYGSQETDLQIIQIDGFGYSDFLPFSRMFRRLRNRKLDNRRERMERQMRKHLADIADGVPPRGKGIVQTENN